MVLCNQDTNTMAGTKASHGHPAQPFFIDNLAGPHACGYLRQDYAGDTCPTAFILRYAGPSRFPLLTVAGLAVVWLLATSTTFPPNLATRMALPHRHRNLGGLNMDDGLGHGQRVGRDGGWSCPPALVSLSLSCSSCHMLGGQCPLSCQPLGECSVAFRSASSLCLLKPCSLAETRFHPESPWAPCLPVEPLAT